MTYAWDNNGTQNAHIKKLKDYLEDNVDEKYYINNEKADKLIKQLIDNGTLPQHNLDRQTDRQTDLR